MTKLNLVTATIPLIFYLIELGIIDSKILRAGKYHFHADWVVIDSHVRVTSHITDTFKGIPLQHCSYQCIQTKDCQSLNYHEKSKTCEILNNTKFDDIGILETAIGWAHYETDEDATQIGDHCKWFSTCEKYQVCEDTFMENPKYRCTCKEHYTGDKCEKYAGPGSSKDNAAPSCQLLFARFRSLPSDTYWIKGRTRPIRKKCKRKDEPETTATGGGKGKPTDSTTRKKNSSISHPTDATTTKKAESTGQQTGGGGGGGEGGQPTRATTISKGGSKGKLPVGYTTGEDGNAYKFHTNERKFENASKICNSEGGTLAIEDSVVIRNYMVKTFGGKGEFWFGLNDSVLEGQWTWVNGKTLGTAYWGDRQPDDSGNADCAIYNWQGQVGQWDDRPCDRNHQFLCQYRPGKYYTSIGCFKDQGRSRAISGKFVKYSPDTVIEQCFQLAVAKGNEYFGVQNNKECFTSEDASKTYFKYGMTTGCENGRGAVLRNDVYRVLNKDSSTNTTTATTTTKTSPAATTKEDTIPVGYSLGDDGNAYKFHEEKLNFDDASDRCKSEGGTLAIEDSEDIRGYMTKAFGDNGNFWVGLSRSAGERLWTWVNGKAIVEKYWGKWQPDSEDHVQGCATYNYGNQAGIWDDIPCGYKKPFLCQYRKVSPATTTTAATTKEDLIGTWKVTYDSGSTATYRFNEDKSVQVVEANFANSIKSSSLKKSEKEKKYPASEGWQMAKNIHQIKLHIYFRVKNSVLEVAYFSPKGKLYTGTGTLQADDASPATTTKTATREATTTKQAVSLDRCDVDITTRVKCDDGTQKQCEALGCCYRDNGCYLGRAPETKYCTDIIEDVSYRTDNILTKSNIDDHLPCRSLCRSNPKCHAWSWGRRKKTCYLKNEDFEQGRASNSNAVSGIKWC